MDEVRLWVTGCGSGGRAECAGRERKAKWTVKESEACSSQRDRKGSGTVECEWKESSRESSLSFAVCVSQGYEGCQMHGSYDQELEGRQIACHTEGSLDGARQVKASPKERPWFLLTRTIS